MKVFSWMMHKPSSPFEWQEREESARSGEVIVAVAGCGVCHTDLGFFSGAVATKHPLPLALGHEVSGIVADAGPGAERWKGRAVLVPAVLPCGDCDACRAGRGSVCPKQIFPGNDLHGGFGTHLRVPARGLCPVPDLADRRANPQGLQLADLSVIADAVSTPFQAIKNSGLSAGDLAIFVGAGGVGGFGAQIAAAFGAAVVVIDPSPSRRALLAEHGAALVLDPVAMDGKALKNAIRNFAQECKIPSFCWKIFETSGTTAGQTTAFNLLAPGAFLGIVGFTPEKLELRLSNVMAFDATVRGTWGCLPEHYPAVLELVLAGKVALEPFLERRPMTAIHQVFADFQSHKISKRVVLIPEMTR